MDEQQQQQNTTTIVNQPSGATLEMKNEQNMAGDLIGQVAEENTQQTATEQQQTQQKQTTENAPSVQEQQKVLNDAEADLNRKGVDFSALEAEFQQNGALSQASYEKLTQAGYPKEMVDGVLAGWKASTDAFVNGVIAKAGGEEQFSRLQNFVKSQGGALADTYNKAIQSGDMGTISMVLENIQNRMTKAYGTANPTIMPGSTSNVATPVGYENVHEMTKDMNDPRYQKDMKFTKEVYRKVKFATFF